MPDNDWSAWKRTREGAGMTMTADQDPYRGLTLDAPSDRCHVALGMVSSLDGASHVDGATSALGGAGDRIAFRRLRDACDAILVGARTVRAEDYRPPVADEARRNDRIARGLAPVPQLVIVTRSGRVDPSMRVFGDEDHPPLVITGGHADVTTTSHRVGHAEFVRVDGDLTMAAVLEILWRRSLVRILCEGGPTVNNLLLAADLIDEIFMTVAPIAVGGAAARIIAGTEASAPRAFRCTATALVAGDLLLRYRRDHSVDAQQPAQ